MSHQTEAVRLSTLLRVSKERRSHLPADLGAFVVLSAAETCMNYPYALGLDDCLVTDAGEVTWESERIDSSEVSLSSLKAMLGAVLVASEGRVPGSLMTIVERQHSSIESFVAELEASLVPLNRDASKRVLARYVRETVKHADAGVDERVERVLHKASSNTSDIETTLEDEPAILDPVALASSPQNAPSPKRWAFAIAIAAVATALGIYALQSGWLS